MNPRWTVGSRTGEKTNLSDRMQHMRPKCEVCGAPTVLISKGVRQCPSCGRRVTTVSPAVNGSTAATPPTSVTKPNARTQTNEGVALAMSEERSDRSTHYTYVQAIQNQLANDKQDLKRRRPPDDDDKSRK